MSLEHSKMESQNHKSFNLGIQQWPEVHKRKLTVPAFGVSLKAFGQRFQAVDVHSARFKHSYKLE